MNSGDVKSVKEIIGDINFPRSAIDENEDTYLNIAIAQGETIPNLMRMIDNSKKL